MGDGGPEGASGGQESQSVLHAKYHDYCSAQLADLLLFLSADEIYLLAKQAQEGRDEAGGVDSYVDMVRVATEWLSERVPLPPYQVWLEDYRRNPASYDQYLMGLWESDVGVDAGEPSSVETPEPH